MPADLLILIAALVVSGLLLTWLLKVVKATFSAALSIATIALVLQLIFGIGPSELWQQVIQVPQQLWEWVTGF